MTTHEKAGLIVRLLLPTAFHDPNGLPDEIAKLTRPQVNAALMVMVAVDRRQQDGPQRFDIDLPALDALTRAAPAPAEILAAARSLSDVDAAHALCELLLLHRDLTAAPLLARASAANN
jgi:hypothetical protein